MKQSLSAHQLRLGLIGASKIANLILPFLREILELKIVGIASSDLSRTIVFAKQHGIRAFDSYRDCFNSPDIDAVYISVLNSHHADRIYEALDANKHVLCEKPLVLRYRDAKELFALAQSKGLILLEGFMYRFHPQVQRISKIIKNRELGNIKSIHVNFSFILETHNTARRTRFGGGGALSDLGCYGIDFIQWILRLDNGGIHSGEPNIKLAFDLDSTGPETIERSITAFLCFPSGITATLECAIDRSSMNVWQVCGDLGTTAITRHNPHGSSPASVFLVNQDSKISSEAIPIEGRSFKQFQDEFSNFTNAILTQQTPFILPEESIANAVLLDRLRALIFNKTYITK